MILSCGGLITVDVFLATQKGKAVYEPVEIMENSAVARPTRGPVSVAAAIYLRKGPQPHTRLLILSTTTLHPIIPTDPITSILGEHPLDISSLGMAEAVQEVPRRSSVFLSHLHVSYSVDEPVDHFRKKHDMLLGLVIRGF